MSPTTPGLPDGVEIVREPRVEVAGIPLHPVPHWTAAFPWLIHGTTGAGAPDEDAADLGFFGSTPTGTLLGRWRTFLQELGVPRAVHSEQVHGSAVVEHMERLPGIHVGHGRDGHVTGYPGILLTVSLADCVPVFLVEERLRRVALLHAGWRGAAAGIVTSGLDALGGDRDRTHAHLGPAICGSCYEVGPEVHRALGLPEPESNTPIDLRAVLARRLVAEGIGPERLTVSAHCTKHGDGFFSHRAGSRGRQMGVLGVR